MLELEHRFRVVDVHARLEPEAGDHATARGRAISPEKLEREMHQAGVVRAVVFPGARPGSSYLSSNNAVARLSVERPFIPFARINGPGKPGDGPSGWVKNLVARRKDWHTTADDIEQYAYDDRFHGFKLSPAVDGLPGEAVLDRLEDVGLPVIVHGGVSFPPEALAETILRWDLPVIYEHFGGHPLQRELMEEAIDMLDVHDALHLDTSYVRYREQLERAIVEHPDRVCFGSGTPASHPNVGVMEILTLDVPEDQMRKLFAKNPSRLIGALAPERSER